MSVGRRANLLLIGFPAAALLVAVLASTLQRVPAGRIGISPSRSVPAGWTIHAPFSPLPTIAARGELTSSDVTLETVEGSTLGFRLEIRYDIAGGLAPQLAIDIRRLGLDAAISGLARRVLADVARQVDVESLLSEPARIEGPLAAALRAAGVTPESISLHSTIGDELIRRRRTEEARALAREPFARLLVVGWDGADWRTALPLMAAGRMPNLARLVREGASGNLRSSDPMFSPLLWTTVATGKAPTEHGIGDFLVKDGKTGERHPITSDFRKVKALWNILGDFDRPSAWIGWWASFPAEAIRGTIVTDYLAAAISRSGAEAAASIPGVASPADALNAQTGLLVAASQITQEEVARIIPVTEPEYRAALVDIGRPVKKGDKTRVDDPVGFVMRVLAQARTYQNIALAQIHSGVPFVAVYYEAIDMMGHGFQHFLPPKMSFVSEADYERFHDAVPNFYAWQDERLGELLRAAGSRTVTMILSDHGFRTGDDRPNFSPSVKGQPEEWHRDWGIVALHGPGVAAIRLPPSSIFDIAPTLLYLAGLPLADDMPGRLIARAFDPGLLARRAPSRTRSFELVGARLERVASVPIDPEVTREMMANLKALGYVGGSEGAPPSASGNVAASSPPAEGTESETQFFFHRNLAVSYMRQGRYREAEAELLLANQRQPRAKTYAMLSEARATQGRFADAAAALEEGWTRLPGEMEPSSLLWIVELQLLTGDYDAAAAVAARWAPKMSAGVRHAVDGRLAEAGGDLARAETLYRQALGEDALLVRIVLRLQDIESGAGRPFSLEPFLLSTLAIHPEVDAYWDLAGQVALARGEHASAAERFRRAVDIEPENGAYLGHLAAAEAAMGREADARDALAWAERFPPRDADGWVAVGAAWDRLGEPDRAVAAFREARESAHAGPKADVGAALALARAGRMVEARRVLDEGLRRYPDNAALRQLAARLGS
jgi:tetratricopeptide (TPR) repeat protein